jgi:protease-4
MHFHAKDTLRRRSDRGYMPSVRALLVLIRNAAVALLALFQAIARRVLRPKSVEWVAFELNGPIGHGSPEELRSLHWRLPRSGRVSTLFELERQLELIRRVPQVKGIVFKLREPHMSAGIMRELRALLRDFKKSGKEILFHADALDTRGYWLASVGTRVWLMPRGRLELVGFAASSSAAAQPLRKLGIVFDVIRAGIFKSAGELFGSDHVSPEQKHQLDELVGDINELFLADVAEDRRLAKEQLQALVDAGPYSARAALEAGLVDALCYGDEVRTRLGAAGERARLGPFAAVLATQSPGADWKPLRDRRQQIAIVDIEGVIAPGKSRTVPGMASTAGSDTLVRTLTQLRYNKGVKAVVLRIDSRGGSALASDLIWRAAKRVAEVKPVVAYLDSVAASGGYYIAAAAKEIWAAPTCITGSIGVFMMRPNASGVFEKVGVDRATVRRGAHATIYRPDHELSETERAVLQRDVLETYSDFVQTVAEGRNLTEARVRELAEGRVYLATRAQSVSLVDQLGTLENAVQSARRLAGIPGEVRVVRMKSRQAGWRELLRMLRRGNGPDAWLALLPPFDAIQAIWLGEEPL